MMITTCESSLSACEAAIFARLFFSQQTGVLAPGSSCISINRFYHHLYHPASTSSYMLNQPTASTPTRSLLAPCISLRTWHCWSIVSASSFFFNIVIVMTNNPHLQGDVLRQLLLPSLAFLLLHSHQLDQHLGTFFELTLYFYHDRHHQSPSSCA